LVLNNDFRSKTMKKGLVKVSAASLVLCGYTATAQNVDPARIQELERQIKALTEEVQRMKEGPATSKEDEDTMKRGFFKSKGLSIGFYGEAKYRFPEEANAVFDPHRFVLTPSYQLNDWLIFNSELEFEHGGIDERSGRSRSRFDGEIELEQFYVDILVNEHFNIRSLGIDLVPVGRINKYHEPTVFYSTERPELYREIIPSTWFEPSVGVFGKIVEGWDYQLMASTGMEDFIPSQDGPGVTAANGFRDARPRLRAADESNPAFSGRLRFNGIPGLDASTSFYVTEMQGVNRSQTWVGLADIEFAYRVPKTGLELRGDFAYWHIDKPSNLLANNNTNALGALVLNDDVGKAMYGWYVEAAYHFWPESWRNGRGKEMDLVPFVRYTDIVTQTRLQGPSQERDDGSTNKDFLTVGLAYFLNANFVLKADYRFNLNGSEAVERQAANQDYFQIGAGVFF
jgi:hypothetical protein